MTAIADRFAAAKKQHQAGNLAEAERLYRQVLAEDDSLARGWYLLGVARWQQGDVVEAEDYLRQAVQRRPDLAAAYNHLGIVLARQKRHAEAIVALREAIRLQPEMADAHNNLGLVLLAGRDLSGAEDSLRQALRLRPDFADAHNNLGLVLRAQGREEEAVRCFHQGRQRQPLSPPIRHDQDDALVKRLALVGPVAAREPSPGPDPVSSAIDHEHGRALLTQGKPAEAVASLQQAIALRPEDATAHNHLGLALLMQGRVDEAVAHFEHALRLGPDDATAHNNLGLALHRQNKGPQALAHWRQAVHLEPHYPQAHNNLGLALLERGELAAAESSLRQAVRLQPDFAEAHNNLSVVLWRQGSSRPCQEALHHWREALRLKPDYHEAHHNLERALLDRERLSGPEGRLREAIRLNPDSAGAHNNLGVALLEREDLDAAESSLREAIRLQPDFPEAHNNLSVILWRQGRLEEARTHVQEALRLRPDFAEAHNNLGNVHHAQGQMEEALACFQRSVELKPAYPDPHLNRALGLLLKGEWSEGWAEYEWRWKLRTVRRRTFRQPLWDGTPLEGRTILLHGEQGLGDTLNFIRYAPLVQARGGRVVVVCQKPLTPLLSGCRGIDRLLAFDEPLPDFDVHAPLLTLARLFGTMPDNVPADVPYLHVAEDRVQRWRLWLTGYQGFKVGIAWQGDRKHRSDRQRSAALAQFAPLAQVPGVHLVGLQKGAGSEQLRDCPFAVTDLGTWLDNSGGAFLDTAAVMKNLDLVVCVDTALGHLAGGLGVPVWLALPFAPDWRWLRERADTPWYPTMRLFRQQGVGDWESVFMDMAAQLRQQVAARHVDPGSGVGVAEH
jgi:Flp pilus assembly protein TadD